MPDRERRKYKTRLMLQDILEKQNVPRATMSLQEAISKESQVKDFIKVAPPSPEE